MAKEQATVEFVSANKSMRGQSAQTFDIRIRRKNGNLVPMRNVPGPIALGDVLDVEITSDGMAKLV